MVATDPGAPKTSRTTCLGLNGTISLARPLLAEVLSFEPKIPCKREIANPTTATTSTATITLLGARIGLTHVVGAGSAVVRLVGGQDVQLAGQARLYGIVSGLIALLIVFVMVVKPFP